MTCNANASGRSATSKQTWCYAIGLFILATSTHTWFYVGVGWGEVAWDVTAFIGPSTSTWWLGIRRSIGTSCRTDVMLRHWLVLLHLSWQMGCWRQSTELLPLRHIAGCCVGGFCWDDGGCGPPIYSHSNGSSTWVNMMVRHCWIYFVANFQSQTWCYGKMLCSWVSFHTYVMLRWDGVGWRLKVGC